MAKTHVTMKVNGAEVEGLVEPRTLLVHFIRENLSLTGTHIGCETTHCGACTVDIDGMSVHRVHPASGKYTAWRMPSEPSALALAEDGLVVATRRGFVHLKMGRFKNAIKDYDAVLRQQPGTAEAIYGRGMAMIKSGKKTCGQADVSKAKALNPDVDDAFRRYGVR